MKNRSVSSHRNSPMIWGRLGSLVCCFAATGCALPKGGPTDHGSASLPGGHPVMPETTAGAMTDTPPVQQASFTDHAGWVGNETHAVPCPACGIAADGAAGGCHCGVPAGAQRFVPMQTAYPAYGIDPQEFLCDGGDRIPKAYLRQDDTIAALQPQDTVVHFTTDAGEVDFSESNRVCVYAPRFASVRHITGAIAGKRSLAASGMEKPVGPVRINLNQPGLVVSDTTELGHADTTRRLDAMRDRNRGVPVEAVLQPLEADEFLAAVAGIRVQELADAKEAQLALLQAGATAAVAWSIEESVEVAIHSLDPPVLTRDQSAEGFTKYDFGEGRLLIGKFADKAHAQPGDIVKFVLRVDNVGDGPVNRVTITDNLTTRLKYVEGSQESSIDADFEAIENDAESVQLVWELTEELDVGQTALLQFECRVR